MANDAWYYQVEGRAIGPVSSAELKQLAASGELAPDTYVRRGADGNWTTAERVRGLFPDVTPAQSQPQMTPPPLAKNPAPAQIAVEQQGQMSRRNAVRSVAPLPHRSYGFLRIYASIQRGLGLFFAVIWIPILVLAAMNDLKPPAEFVFTVFLSCISLGIGLFFTGELLGLMIDLVENTRHTSDLIRAAYSDDSEA